MLGGRTDKNPRVFLLVTAEPLVGCRVLLSAVEHYTFSAPNSTSLTSFEC